MGIDQLEARLRIFQEELNQADGRPVVRTPAGPPTMSIVYDLLEALRSLESRVGSVEAAATESKFEPDRMD